MSEISYNREKQTIYCEDGRVFSFKDFASVSYLSMDRPHLSLGGPVVQVEYKQGGYAAWRFKNVEEYHTIRKILEEIL